MSPAPHRRHDPDRIEVDYRDIEFFDRHAKWPEGTAPEWARALAKELSTTPGSAKLIDEARRRHIEALMATLEPFAAFGEHTPARSDGILGKIELDGPPYSVKITYDDCRRAARTTGRGVKRVTAEAQVLGASDLVDGAVLRWVRYRRGFSDTAAWLVLRERPARATPDSERTLESLGHEGRTIATMRFKAADELPDHWRTPFLLQETARIEAIASLSRQTPSRSRSTQSHARERYTDPAASTIGLGDWSR